MKMMSEDAKAIMLLCGRFGGISDQEPLNQREYNKVVQWLVGRSLRPSDLLLPEHVSELSAGVGMPESRLSSLMARGVTLGFAIEQWSQSGIWVICRSDPEYPARLKLHLKDKAPPILFGTGNDKLLSGGGLAVVGSRDVDQEGEDFTRQVALWCAGHHVPVVSGGARGVDQTSMSSALEAGGVVIGVLADSLLKRSVSRDVRYALADEKLLLLSPYHPEAGFSVGNAMGRNKLIYAMADYGLVVSAEFKKGGTWEGATEELKRSPGRPLFVRMSGHVPKGNKELLTLGGIPFPRFTAADDPLDVLKEAKSRAKSPAAPAEELLLFDRPVIDKVAAIAMENRPVYGKASDHADGPESPALTAASIYEVVLPLLVSSVSEPSTAEELAKRLDLTKSQLQTWLKRAVADKKIIKKGRPVKYVKA